LGMDYFGCFIVAMRICHEKLDYNLDIRAE
jgi:hypothetical protein